MIHDDSGDDSPAPLPSPSVLIGGLLALIGLLYLPTLGFTLVYDDAWTLQSNGFLREFDLDVLLSPDAVARHIPDAFRPTLVSFDAASYALFGMNAPAQHGISIALHLGVCLLIYRLLANIGAPLLERASVMVVFGVMAIHAEAVAVVSFREDLLAAMLGLAALLLAQRSLRVSLARSLPLLCGALLLQTLACLAKMSAAPLPLFWLLIAWRSPWISPSRHNPSRRRMWIAALFLMAGLALALAHTFAIHGSFSPYDPAHNPRILASRVGLSPTLAASAEIHLSYLRQMLIPVGLSPEYADFAGSWSDAPTLLSALGLSALGVFGLIAALQGRHRVAAITIVGLVLLGAPTSNLVGMPNMRADRFMYLPSLAMSFGLALGGLKLGRWLDRWAARKFSRASDLALHVAPLVLLVILQGSFCMATMTTYASNTTLWEVGVKRAPDSARAQALDGLRRLADAGDRARIDPELLRRVRLACDTATSLDPRYELPEICHARLAVVERRWDAAYAHYNRALALSVDRNDGVLAALAQISWDLPGRTRSERDSLSRGHLRSGLHAYPYSPALHATAALLAHQAGEPARAAHHIRRARSLRPQRWQTVVEGIELALDLGDAAAAYRTWLEEHKILERANPAIRSALRRRLAAAQRHQPFTVLQSLCRPGVFNDEPPGVFLDEP